MYNSIIQFVREQYCTNEFIPLHVPRFEGNERKYVLDTLESTFVSSVGSYVDQFEVKMAEYTLSPSAVVTVNGTSALHTALILAGVGPGDYVITQCLTFVATCNAIAYCGAEPIFLDVNPQNLGLSVPAVDAWLNEFAFFNNEGQCCFRENNRPIKVCLPMHTFGHPADLDGLLEVCHRWRLIMVEDAAESLGSLYKGRHTGVFGTLGILSFNGNKIITTGGGGMILTSKELGQKAKHLTTTAKKPHLYEYFHDEIGFNYRMPNINAALGCAQLEQLERYIKIKRLLAKGYQNLFSNSSMQFISEPKECRSNYWLNAIICEDKKQRDELLKVTNESGIMTRPIWQPMNQLPMFRNALTGPLVWTEWLVDRVVNLPSSVTNHEATHA